MNNERLAYWRKGEQDQNFGDFLSEYLAQELFYIFDEDTDLRIIGSVIDDMMIPNAGRDIGESVGKAPPRVSFWGCGIRNLGGLSPAEREKVDLFGVRGPISASDLRLGAGTPVGDTALLMPALYTPRPSPRVKGRTVCIPHFHDQRSDEELRSLCGCDLVLRPNIRNNIDDLLGMVDALASANFVLSASLHGAIVAAAYKVPFSYWDNGLLDLPLKWDDFSRSVEIEMHGMNSISEAMVFYTEKISANIKIPSMWPMLASSPCLLKPAALLSVLRYELSLDERVDLERISDRLDDFRSRASHFDALAERTRSYYSGRISALKESVTEHEGIVADLEANLLRSAQFAAEQGSEFATRVSAADNRVAELAVEIAELYQQLHASSARVRYLEVECASVQATLGQRAPSKSLEDILQTLDSEIADLGESLAASEARNALLEQEVLSLGAQAAELAGAPELLAAAEARIVNLDHAISLLTAEAKLERAAYEQSIADSLRQVAAAREINERLQSENRQLGQNLTSLSQEYASLEVALRQARDEHEQTLEQFREADQRVADSDGGLANLRSEFEKLEKTLMGMRRSFAWRAAALVSTLAKIYNHLLPDIKRNPLFDEAYYSRRYPDVGRSGIKPYRHYLKYGAAEGRDPNPMFDTDWYVNRYPDVKESGANALNHYYRHGAAEGRDPHPLFSTLSYIAQHPEALSGGLNPLEHYLRSNADRVPELEERRITGSNPLVDKIGIESPQSKSPYKRLPIAENEKRILVIDSIYPTPDRDSGSVDAVNFVKIFSKLGFRVYFVASTEFDHYLPDPISEAARHNLESIGATIVDGRYAESVDEFLRLNSGYFQIAFLSRVYCGGAFFEQIKRHGPSVSTIFNTVDLHYLRERREGELHGDNVAINKSYWTEEREQYIARLADATIVVSKHEADLLSKAVPGSNVYQIPLIRDVPGRKNGHAPRRNIGFVGGFKHMPNIDAVKYFLDEIWPIVRAETPDAKFLVLGADIPDDILRRTDAGLKVVGYVEELGPHFEMLRLTVAPLRFGAGAKGKVISSLSHGLPCVGTSIAAEGMPTGPGECSGILVADTAASFAAQVVRLYNDENTWECCSLAGIDYAGKDHSFDNGVRIIQTMVADIDREMNGYSL